jgi:hypothetical protein
VRPIIHSKAVSKLGMDVFVHPIGPTEYHVIANAKSPTT